MKKPITQREILVQLMKGVSPFYLERQYRSCGWTEDEIIALKKIAKQDFIIEKRNNKPFPVWDKEGV